MQGTCTVLLMLLQALVYGKLHWASLAGVGVEGLGEGGKEAETRCSRTCSVGGEWEAGLGPGTCAAHCWAALGSPRLLRSVLLFEMVEIQVELLGLLLHYSG